MTSRRKMDAILTDSHLDTRIKRFIMIDMMVPKRARVGRKSTGREPGSS